MELGRVTGAVWCTRKHSGLEGRKLLLAQPWDAVADRPLDGPLRVCADLIGAGIGERVLLCAGSAARYAAGAPNAPIDAAIVGILDDWDVES